MTVELTVLVYAALLQVVQYVAMSIPANLELGVAKTLSARDPEQMGGALIDQVSPTTSRLIRALNNHFEGLVLFTIACMVVTLSDQSSAVTQVCAWTYLVARIAYVPAYALGLSPWRSVVWGIGFLATVIMLLASLF